MVDTTTLVLMATVVQTVVITLTLCVFIFQFRSQEKAIRESAVQSAMGRYTDYIRMLVERPELTKLLNQQTGVFGENVSPEDQVTAAYLLLGYGIFEEFYGLHKRGWMDDDTWRQWSEFLRRMTRQPLFQRIHKITAGTFDGDFQTLVTKMIDEANASPSEP